ncbi:MULTISPECIES: hypothetical protein [unclassified Streptomyces]|uniref:hypothetical protein n=1 Tax=unclassified Streptomyces TaxID=2593676 RepID=UPI00226EA4EA|nr:MULTISPECIES: hypothetical protein [unclassified Streptomyces]MCY0923517.1 hypothetical protein [Streptomyces sp. H27-G5]MCY0961639.1 hypothetical protein [Streptomyces sp. H27-H5]
MPTTTTADLEDEHAIEQYGHPLAELISERYTVQEVLKDRHRRKATPQAAPAPTRKPDPHAAEHYAVLEAAIATWTYRPAGTR